MGGLRGVQRWMWTAWMLAVPLHVFAQTTDARAPLEVLDSPAVSDQRGVLANLFASDDAAFPVELLAEKVREGIAKRVPAPRIVEAVRVVRARVDLAAELLAGAALTPVPARKAAVRALVDALNAGLSRRDLEGVLASLGSASRDLVAVREVAVTLAELAERGFNVTTVIAATRTAWRRGGVNALPSVIALASQLGPNVAARDAALEQAVSQATGTPGVARVSTQHSSGPAREPGPPHDDAFGAAQQRGRGLAKGRNK